MGFVSGTVTFKRFRVQGRRPEGADEALLEKLSARAVTRDGLQTCDRTLYGWTTGDHILDTDFDPAKNIMADGLHFGLRIDTNRPPAELLRSYQRMHEQVLLETSGRAFLTKPERREAREQAVAQAEAEARSGTFRRMKQIPVFWDLHRGEVYLGSAASTVIEHFASLFHATFDCALVPVTAGELAAHWASRIGETGGFDSCRPAHFVRPPEGFDGSDDRFDEDRDIQSRDFLGTEWLTWLQYSSHAAAPDLASVRSRPVTVFFEKSLQLQCAFRMTGTTTVMAENPTRLPECAAALAVGKLPVRAGLEMAVGDSVFNLTIRGDAMNYSGVRLPPTEGLPHPRAILEQRFEQLRDVIEAADALYATFLKRRLVSRKWTPMLNAIREWIAMACKAGTASAGLPAAS